MKKAIILIDGENFQYKIEQIIKAEKLKPEVYDVGTIDLKELIGNVFKDEKDLEISEIRYYSAKLHKYKETLEKSNELIDRQRILKNTLNKQGIVSVLAGHVRAQFVKTGKAAKAVFKEKGVDVRIAVDMVSLAADKLVDTIILCSSDSDLQPAVKEAKDRKINVIYLGFSIDPNKGLTFTTNKTILFRNPEILKAIRKNANSNRPDKSRQSQPEKHQSSEASNRWVWLLNQGFTL